MAAGRELREELGLESPIEKFGKFLLPPIYSNDHTEVEWVTLFTSLSDAPLNIDLVEVESVTEVAQRELRKILAAWPLTPDAKIILREYLKSADPAKRL